MKRVFSLIAALILIVTAIFAQSRSYGPPASATLPTYVLASFNGTSDLAEFAWTPDFTAATPLWFDLPYYPFNFPQIRPTPVSLRDPHLQKISGTYYLAHTGVASSNTAWYFLTCDARMTCSGDTAVSVTGSVPTSTNVWAPRFFIDTDGTLRVYLAISTDSAGHFEIYESHCTSGGNVPTCTWSNPAAVWTGNAIDPFVMCIDNVN